jgi:hypothetical protein
MHPRGMIYHGGQLFIARKPLPRRCIWVVACFCHAWRVDPAKRARNRNKKWTGLFSKYNLKKLKKNPH